ncbi:MAG: helix-turn-helix transcriptional regulator [Clostridia bacterium]|nr:helix-turn-helix transcriptional regulator [Clostridia bacterium]
MQLDILSNLVIQKVYSTTTLYSEENRKAKRVNREKWAVIIKYEGETVYTSRGSTYISNANNLIILPKGCSYEWSCKRSGHFSVIEFESEATCDTIFCFPVQNSDKILKLFKELEYKRTLKKPLFEAESIRDTYSIILLLTQALQRKYLPTKKADKLTPALDYMAKNYNLPITNDKLSSLTGLSTVYFRKLFTEVYGISPITYVHKLRIKKAKEMLGSDYGSITNIAEALGYLNIYDFSRAFKKHVGVSPLKYEKNMHKVR